MDPEEPTSVQGPLRPFARDVAVNVLANLVAAAIIYLLGLAAGLLPRSPILIWVAVVMAAGAAGGAILGSKVVYSRRGRYISSVGIGAFGLAALVFAAVYPQYWLSLVAIGTVLLVLGGFTVVLTMQASHLH